MRFIVNSVVRTWGHDRGLGPVVERWVPGPVGGEPVRVWVVKWSVTENSFE